MESFSHISTVAESHTPLWVREYRLIEDSLSRLKQDSISYTPKSANQSFLVRVELSCSGLPVSISGGVDIKKDDNSVQPRFEGIAFFPKQRVERYNLPEVHLFPDDVSCSTYQELLIRIYNLQNQKSGNDRIAESVNRLEIRRNGLHTVYAEEIIEKLKQQGITCDIDNARTLFQSLFYIWQCAKEDVISYSEIGWDGYGILMDKVVQEEIIKRAKKELEIDIEFAPLTFNWHNDDPQSQVDITMKGTLVKAKQEALHKIVEEVARIKPHIETE